MGNINVCSFVESVCDQLYLQQLLKYVTAFVFSSSTDPDTSDKTAEQTKSSKEGLQATGTYICMFLQFTNKFGLFCWELKSLFVDPKVYFLGRGDLLYRLYRYEWNQRVLDHFGLNLGTSLRNWYLEMGISL